MAHGFALGRPLANYAATAAPTTGDDADDGYGVGSFWHDTTNDVAYVCLDATAGAAVWYQISDKWPEVYAVTTGDQTSISSTTYTDVTNTGLAVAASAKYEFQFLLICDANATTTGLDVACNGPSSPTSICYEQVYWTSATARTERCATAYDNNTASTGSNGTAAKLFEVRGILVNGANSGTLIARIKAESGSSGTVNVRTGSFGRLKRLA